jgi:hypothetical protein
MEKRCFLDEEKLCVDCGQCMMCDLDPEKLCDNCMRCVKKSDADYLAIEIDEVIDGTSPDDVQPNRSPAKPSAAKAIRPGKPGKTT